MAAGNTKSVLAAAAERYALALADEQLERLERYVEMVFRWQRIANLTAAAGPASFVREHVVDCLAVLPHLPPGRLLDVGSGAGLPGIVIAVCEPVRPVTLLEARAKRARFLTQAAIELDLAAVDVVNARAERFRPAAPYAVIITRAFGSLADFAAVTSGAQGAATELLAMKAAVLADELTQVGPSRVIPLTVPGFRERQLVAISCSVPGRAGEAGGLVP